MFAGATSSIINNKSIINAFYGLYKHIKYGIATTNRTIIVGIINKYESYHFFYWCLI